MAATHAAAFDDARPWSEDEFTALCQSPQCIIVGDTRAFALARVISDEAELLTIATAPAHRRQGLARACMTDWEAEARTRGATRAFLEVASDNAAAHALYLALGYTPCGHRTAYYKRTDGSSADAVVMEKDLTLGQR